MSFEITTAMVDKFSANVMHLAQQKESRLFQYCRKEVQNAESSFYDRIGQRKARRKEGRHSDVVYTDTPHSRRMVVMDDYYDSDLVDQEDKIRVIMEPASEYLKAIGSSLGRQMDEVIIDFALGNAFGGNKGTESVALPLAQKIVAHNGTATAAIAMNVRTLRAVRKKFRQNEAVDPKEQIIFACSAQVIDDLLGTTEVTSSDFATVKALVQGDVDTFMGFTFVQLELLPFNVGTVSFNNTTGQAVNSGGAGTVADGSARRSFAFTANRCLLCATGRMVKGRIDEIPGKHYAWQVYGAMSIGGTRMEEVQVVEVLSLES
jgi:hypothetical protein